MKNIFFALSILFGLIGFIVALQNIMISAPVQIFFQTVTGSLFSSLSFVLVVGITSGFCLGVGIMMKKKKTTVDISDL